MSAKKVLLTFIGMMFINTSVQGEEWGRIKCLRECTNTSCADATKRELCKTNCVQNLDSIGACLKATDQASPQSAKTNSTPRITPEKQPTIPTPTKRALPQAPKAQPSAEKPTKEANQCICLKMGSLKEKLPISCNTPTSSGFRPSAYASDPCSKQCSSDANGDTLKSFSENNATSACEQEASILKNSIGNIIPKYDEKVKEAEKILESKKVEIHNQYKATLTEGMAFSGMWE